MQSQWFPSLTKELLVRVRIIQAVKFRKGNFVLSYHKKLFKLGMTSLCLFFLVWGKEIENKKTSLSIATNPKFKMFVQKFLAYCLQLPSSFLKVFLLSDMIFSVVNKGSVIYINCVGVGAWVVQKKKAHWKSNYYWFAAKRRSQRTFPLYPMEVYFQLCCTQYFHKWLMTGENMHETI